MQHTAQSPKQAQAQTQRRVGVGPVSGGALPHSVFFLFFFGITPPPWFPLPLAQGTQIPALLRMTFPHGGRRRCAGQGRGPGGGGSGTSGAQTAGAVSAAVLGAAAALPTDPPPSHTLALAAKKAEQAYLCARLHKALQGLGKVRVVLGTHDTPTRKPFDFEGQTLPNKEAFLRL